MSIFSEEWRECMRAQYRHVVRAGDVITKESLTHVMMEVGFTESELNQLRMEATIRTEDVPEDFVPDMEVLETEKPQRTEQPQAEGEFIPHPLECQCPRCVEVNLVPHDEDGQPLPVEEEEQQAAQHNERDPNDPQQLTLF